MAGRLDRAIKSRRRSDALARAAARTMVTELLDLPTFPHVASRLAEATRDDNQSIQDVARIIERDQAVASKILRVANSPMFGSRREIQTIGHAAAMLGMENVRKYALAIAVFGSSPADSAEYEQRKRIWIHALAVGMTTRLLSERLGIGDPSAMFVAGLIHDAGKAAIEVLRPGKYAQVGERAAAERLDLLSAERAVYGTDHCLVGAELAERWSLPQELVEVMAWHHDTRLVETAQSGDLTPAHVVHLANFLCHTIGMGTHEDGPAIHADVAAWGALGYDILDMVDLLGEVEAELHGSLLEFNLGDVDLTELCDVDGEAADGSVLTLDSTAVQRQLRRRILDLSLVTDGVLSLGGEATAEEVLTATAEGPLGRLDFDRVIVYRVAPDRTHLEPVAAHGVLHTDGLPSLSMLGRAEPIVQVALAGKPARLRIGRDFHPGSSALLDQLDPGSVAAVPLVVDGATTALLLADNGLSGRSISGADLEILTAIGKQLELALGRAIAYERLLTRAGQLEDMALRDPLTGLHNNRYLTQALERELADAQRQAGNLSVLMLDIDHFKAVNDTFGHQAGDEVLRAVAQIANERLRDLDILCRYGGEEFTAILPGTPKAVGAIPAENVRRAIAGADMAQLVQGDPDFRVTISVGLATYPDDAVTGPELISIADQALYRAKTSGRNRVVAAGR